MDFSNRPVLSVCPDHSDHKDHDKKNEKNYTTGAEHRLLANIPLFLLKWLYF